MYIYAFLNKTLELMFLKLKGNDAYTDGKFPKQVGC